MILLIACGAITYTPSVPDIPIMHRWIDPPLLVVCPGVAGGYERWANAARRTERHGAQWHGVVPGACGGMPGPGEVWAVPVEEVLTGDDGILGITLVESTRGVAQWGITGVRQEAALLWTVEHELLHVQGLDHHTMTEHVMNRDVESGGWDWDGVRRALRDAWSR